MFTLFAMKTWWEVSSWLCHVWFSSRHIFHGSQNIIFRLFCYWTCYFFSFSGVNNILQILFILYMSPLLGILESIDQLLDTDLTQIQRLPQKGYLALFYGILTITFSTIKTQIWFTTLSSQSMNSFTDSDFLIFRVSYSLFRLNICICLILELPWNSSWSLSQAFLVVSQVMIFMNMVSLTNECKELSALKCLDISSSCNFVWARVGFVTS